MNRSVTIEESVVWGTMLFHLMSSFGAVSFAAFSFSALLYSSNQARNAATNSRITAAAAVTHTIQLFDQLCSTPTTPMIVKTAQLSKDHQCLPKAFRNIHSTI